MNEKLVCAYCISAMFSDHARLYGLWIKEDEKLEYHGPTLVEAVLAGKTVIDKSVMQTMNLAVTIVDNTALCGWHAWGIVRRRPI